MWGDPASCEQCHSRGVDPGLSGERKQGKIHTRAHTHIQSLCFNCGHNVISSLKLLLPCLPRYNGPCAGIELKQILSFPGRLFLRIFLSQQHKPKRRPLGLYWKWIWRYQLEQLNFGIPVMLTLLGRYSHYSHAWEYRNEETALQAKYRKRLNTRFLYHPTTLFLEEWKFIMKV